MERRVRGNSHARCGVGEKLEVTSKAYLSLSERMEFLGNKVIPLRSSLPDKCFVYVESTDEIGIVDKGEMGYCPAGVAPEKGVSKRQAVDYLNDAQGIGKAQATAMKAGSLCGWATKAADPANYNDQGNLINSKTKNRGEAR